MLKYAQAVEIERIARDKGLFVGVEYHKRFDRRALDARLQYRARPFRPVPLRRGQAGRALLLPPLELPELVHHGEQRPLHLHRLPLRGPGLFHHRPAAGRGLGPRRGRQVSQRQRRLSLVDRPGRLGERRGAERAQRAGLSRRGPRARTTRACACSARATTAARSSATTTSSAASATATSIAARGAAFRFVSPDYFRLVPWEGDGLKPVGYGYDSDRGQRAAALRGQRGRAGLTADAWPSGRSARRDRPPGDHRHARQQFHQRVGDRSRPALDCRRRAVGRHRLRAGRGRAAGVDKLGVRRLASAFQNARIAVRRGIARRAAGRYGKRGQAPALQRRIRR